MDEKARLLQQAERCRRIAENINNLETAEAIRNLAEQYERRAEAIGTEGSSVLGAKERVAQMTPSSTGQEVALAILRQFEEARSELLGQAVILSDGKAGTICKVFLDELHGLRVSIEGHEGQWPISTIKLSGDGDRR